jgi:hypothetical protein
MLGLTQTDHDFLEEFRVLTNDVCAVLRESGRQDLATSFALKAGGAIGTALKLDRKIIDGTPRPAVITLKYLCDKVVEVFEEAWATDVLDDNRMDMMRKVLGAVLGSVHKTLLVTAPDEQAKKEAALMAFESIQILGHTLQRDLEEAGLGSIAHIETGELETTTEVKK